jgi:glycosyltransferase involved in cell wall biosynthesis
MCLRWKPDVLVASGVWISHAWRTLARIRDEFGIPVSFDMHGALEELIEYNLAFGSRLASGLLFQSCRRAEAAILQHCADHIEVVSRNMEQYIRDTYPAFPGSVTVVPCGIDAPIDQAAYERKRHHWRDRLGLDPSRPAAVYSGSIAKWQRVDDMLDLARAQPRLQVHLLLVGDPSLFPVDVPQNVRIASLPHPEAVDALCAFDFGFLLRRSDLTNFVAFPNKVGEYLNARLRIIVDSRNIGCINEELSDAFISVADVDFTRRTENPATFDLHSILWSGLAARLLSQYIEVRSAMVSHGNLRSFFGRSVLPARTDVQLQA